MSKLKLIAKAILADIKNPDIPDEKKLETIEENVKVFAVESVNLLLFLKDNNVTAEVLTGLMEAQGFVMDGRTKKFK